MKLQNWKEAQIVARALQKWLTQHCPSCGKRHTAACVDGGRCVYCLKSLCAVSSLAEAVKESAGLLKGES